MLIDRDDTRTDAATERAGDGAILDLFRELVAFNTAMQELGRTAPERDQTYEAMVAQQSTMEKAIAVIPSSGAVGMAIKAYLMHQTETGATGDNINGIDAPPSIDECTYTSEKMRAGIIADALRVFPPLDALRKRGADAFNAAIAQQTTDALRRSLLDTTAPFAVAFDAYRIAEGDHVAKFGPAAIDGEGEPSEEHNRICERFRAAAEAAPAPSTLADALAVLEYFIGNLDIDIAAIELPDEVKLKLLRGAWGTVYRAMNAGRAAFEQVEGASTVVPALGMTFEAALAELRRLDAIAAGANPDAAETAGMDGDSIIDAILATPPQTAADARVILDLVTDPDYGIGASGVGERDIAALQNVAAFLSREDPDFRFVRDFLRMRELDKIMSESADTSEYEEEDDALINRFATDPAAGLLGIFAKMANILFVMRASVPNIETEGAPCEMELRTAMIAAEQLPDPAVRSLAVTAVESLAEAVRALDNAERELGEEKARRIADYEWAKRWNFLNEIFQKYAADEERERWARRTGFAPKASEDRNKHKEKLLDLLLELPQEQLDRWIERVELAGLQMKAHRANLEICKIDGVLPRYREQIAADLAEVDAAMGHAQPDAFADTIAAFDGASPKPLAIPDTPTDAMLQAGAAAAGIAPEQARAMFAAMVEAYRKEAA